MADSQLALLKTKQFAYTEVCNSSGGGRGAGGPALTACICSGRRLLQTAIQFCNCLRDTYMASCFSQNKLLIVLRNVGGKCDIRSRVSCVMSAIQHFHFYVIYKLNCKIFCICKISTTKQFCTINVDIYLMRMNPRQAVQHLNAASVVCELPRLWGVVQGFPVNRMQLILAGQQPRLVAHYCIAASDVGLLDYSWMWLDPMLCILIVHAWFKHLFENINIIHTEPHRTHRSIYKSTWFLKH